MTIWESGGFKSSLYGLWGSVETAIEWIKIAAMSLTVIMDPKDQEANGEIG